MVIPDTERRGIPCVPRSRRKAALAPVLCSASGFVGDSAGFLDVCVDQRAGRGLVGHPRSGEDLGQAERAVARYLVLARSSD